MSYVGVGWIVWRDKEHLPKELIFELHYLGSVEYSFSLNFSRPAAPIIGQYFSFINLGHEGYRKIGLADMKNARMLSRALEKTGYYTVISDIHRAIGARDDLGIDSDEIEVSTWMVTCALMDANSHDRTTSPDSPLWHSASATL